MCSVLVIYRWRQLRVALLSPANCRVVMQIVLSDFLQRFSDVVDCFYSALTVFIGFRCRILLHPLRLDSFAFLHLHTARSVDCQVNFCFGIEKLLNFVTLLLLYHFLKAPDHLVLFFYLPK